METISKTPKNTPTFYCEKDPNMIFFLYYSRTKVTAFVYLSGMFPTLIASLFIPIPIT